MTTATLTDAATVTLAFPLAAAEGLRHAITLAIHERPTSERDMLASIYGALVNPQPAPTARSAGAAVDVLATYDRLIREVPMGLGHMQNIVAARAAIAELIEAAGEVVACFGEDEQWWERAYDTYMTGDNAGSDMLIRNSQDVRALILENFRAALARVGGGK